MLLPYSTKTTAFEPKVFVNLPSTVMVRDQGDNTNFSAAACTRRWNDNRMSRCRHRCPTLVNASRALPICEQNSLGIRLPGEVELLKGQELITPSNALRTRKGLGFQPIPSFINKLHVECALSFR